jgi:hypothetical protein
MAKPSAPADPATLAEQAKRWSQPLIESLADNFVSLYLYGSAVEPGFVPGKSDLNLLLITRALSGSTLRALASVWPGDSVAGSRVDLVALTSDQVSRSLDSFALEIADVRARGKLIEGHDALGKDPVPLEALRTHLERELRILGVRLRRGFLAARHEPEALSGILASSVGTLVACARGIGYLNGAPVPSGAEASLTWSASWAGIDPRAWLEAWRLRRDPISSASVETLYIDFLDSCDALARGVDRFVSSGSPSRSSTTAHA